MLVHKSYVDADGDHRRDADRSGCSSRCCSSCAPTRSATPPTASTSNSVGGCFHHLFRLPLAYFETRAAGQTVARVRELETIRSFLTGQGLTSLLDLVFTLVFFAVMFIYSAKLTLIVLALDSGLRRHRGADPAAVLREQINEKFNRGARSQQFLVESIVGAQTLKAASVEPMMQAQWEERLAAYVSTSFDAGVLGVAGPEPDPVRQQGDDGADPVLRRRGGDRRAR